MTARSAYGGWPLVLSQAHPGEMTIGCPHCGSIDITITGAYAARGTGPGGMGRLGDPGGLDWAECNGCKKRGYKSPKLRFVIALDNLDDREGLAMVMVQGRGALAWARDDQSIDGSRWEGADGDDFAYALVMDRPDLVEALHKDGYELNLDNYSPPDAAEG